ncbi:MAG: MATE family efflux transporter [Oscillospiraceae bacterium]|nr:MATE family efflux transporter [Oscillospiraceae bacterium]
MQSDSIAIFMQQNPGYGELMKLLKMDKSERNELISMFVPTFIEQLTIHVVGLIITAIIKVSGTEAVAAVSLLNSLIALFQQSFASIGIGVTVVVAQLRGRGDPKATGKAASQSVILALMTSISVAILCYIFMEPILKMIFQLSEPKVFEYGRTYYMFNTISLPLIAIYSIASAAIRGSGHATSSLAATIINSVSHVGVAYITVYWFDMGLTGICVALVFSRVVAAIVGYTQLRKGNSDLERSRITLKVEKSVAKPVFKVALPILMENLFFSGGRLVTQAFSVVYGTSAVAANGIANNIHGVMLVPAITASSIAQPIIGRYCGKGDLKGAHRKGKQILVMTIILMIFTAIVTFSFMKPLTGFMTNDPEVQQLAYPVIISYCLAIPFLWTLGFVIPSILRSSGDVKFTSLVCMAAMVLMRLTTGYLLAIVFRVGIIGIWFSMYLDWIVRVVFFLPRFLSGKWLEFNVLD